MREIFDVSLKPFNTFHVDNIAKHFFIVKSIDDIQKLVRKNIFKKDFLILGGGSNTLFSKNFDGTIIKIEIKGKEILEENSEWIHLKVGAGEDFDKLVQWSVKHNYLGLQNLAQIPGSVGATPVQNVGAYGSEIKDVLTSVEYIDLGTGEIRNIKNKNCKFGYRESVFKNELEGKSLISSVSLKLKKLQNREEVPNNYLQYSEILQTLQNKFKPPFTIEKVYKTICMIRKQKLPDVKKYGSCGSTFENPIITQSQYDHIKEKYPELPSYPTEDSSLVKIPAAYIFEKIGWKDKRVGNTGTWKHPLIVTNYDQASGKEILDVIRQMQEDFYTATGIRIDTEINII